VRRIARCAAGADSGGRDTGPDRPVWARFRSGRHEIPVRATAPRASPRGASLNRRLSGARAVPAVRGARQPGVVLVPRPRSGAARGRAAAVEAESASRSPARGRASGWTKRRSPRWRGYGTSSFANRPSAPARPLLCPAGAARRARRDAASPGRGAGRATAEAPFGAGFRFASRRRIAVRPSFTRRGFATPATARSCGPHLGPPLKRAQSPSRSGEATWRSSPSHRAGTERVPREGCRATDPAGRRDASTARSSSPAGRSVSDPPARGNGEMRGLRLDRS